MLSRKQQKMFKYEDDVEKPHPGTPIGEHEPFIPESIKVPGFMNFGP